MNTPALRAVLWDMDGTLVDTEPYWMAAESPLVEEYGGTWSHEQALGMVGLGLEDAARLLQEAGVRLGVDEIVETLTNRVQGALASQGVPFRPGAQELLRALKDDGMTTALVTMSLRRMALSVVDLMEHGAFDLVIAGDDVTRPKPFPDPYLQAAEVLGVDIRDTVAIEDSPNGVRSAVAAGCTVIGVTNFISLEGSGAHYILSTLDGVTPLDLETMLVQHVGRAERSA